MAVAIMSQGNVLAEGLLSELPLRQRLATILAADVAGYSRLMGSRRARHGRRARPGARGLPRVDREPRGPSDRHGRRFGARGVRRRHLCGQVRPGGAAQPVRGRAGPGRGLQDALSHRRASRRRHGEERRQRLRRRRQHRRPARVAGRAGRGGDFRAGAVGGEEARRRPLRGFRRARGQEHRRAGAHLPLPSRSGRKPRRRRRGAAGPRRRTSRRRPSPQRHASAPTSRRSPCCRSTT